MNLAQQYIDSVMSGEELVGNYARLAVQRHLSDLEGLEAYYFDEDLAQRAINFTSILKHTEGKWANQPFNLQPYQAFIRWVLYGWRREKDNGRRFTKAYLEMARKNGKSQDAAAHISYNFELETDHRAQLYSAATTRDQAKMVFEMARSMMVKLSQDSDLVKQHLGVHKYRVFREDNESFIEALAADAHTLDGLNPYMAVVDEYHAHKNSDIVDVLESGMGARQNPLLFIITTAGFNVDGPCYQFRKNIIDILEAKYDHPQTFGIIYTLDEEDDWKDETVWKKANPNLGQTIDLDWMKAQRDAAIAEGGQKEVSFKTKNLNIWTRSSQTFIQRERWQKCDFGEPIDPQEPCWIGVDLSSNRDISALAKIWPPSDNSDKLRVKVEQYIPEETIDLRVKRYGFPYRQWVNDGFLHATHGNAQDQSVILDDFLEFAETHNIVAMSYDPFQASFFAGEVEKRGFQIYKCPQLPSVLTEPTKYFEKIVLDQELDHYGDPVLEWMIGNTVLRITRNGSLMMPTKEKDQFKIDGIMATIMAIEAYLSTEQEDGTSIYETQMGFKGV